RNVDDRLVQERKRNVDASQIAGTRHLRQIVVGESELEVEREQPVDQARSFTGMVGLMQPCARLSLIDLRKKLGVEQVRRAQTFEQVVAFVACRHRKASLLDVAACFSNEGNGICSPCAQQRLQHPLSQGLGNALVEGQLILLRVARIASEQLVTSVAAEQPLHAVRLGK